MEPHMVQCRLHNMVFNLPSMHYEHSKRHDVDPYEFSTATSSQLASILVSETLLSGLTGVEFNREAALELVKLNPHLKHVHVFTEVDNPGAITAYMRQVLWDRPSWHGFFLEESRRKEEYEKLNIPLSYTQAHLQSFSLNPASSADIFHNWEQAVRFSLLQCLQLWEVKTPVLLAAAKCHFRSLKTLVLDPDFGTIKDNLHEGDEAASEFIASLHTDLESIQLSTEAATRVHKMYTREYRLVSTKNIRAIIGTHGSSLKRLSLITNRFGTLSGTPISPTQIRKICTGCPNLHDLRVSIQRSTGYPDEVQAYQAIGSLPHLRDLTLQLYCQAYSRHPNMTTRNLLINAAVDKSLVRSIVGIIVDSRPSSRLQNVQLQTKHSGSFIDQLSGILGRVNSRWRCHRFARPCRGSGKSEASVIVEQVTNSRPTSDGDKGEVELGEFESVFRELWPANGGKWEDEWHNFPLESKEHH